MADTRFIVAVIVMLLVSFAAGAEGPDPAAALQETVKKGREAFESGDYLSAQELSQAAIKLDRTSPDALELFGRTHLAVGDPHTARGALNFLAVKRGTVEDYRLLALAHTMSGNPSGAAAALLKAEAAKAPTPEGLYALTWAKGTGRERADLLRRIVGEFPAAGGALAPEIAFWEGRKDLSLGQPGAAPGKEGIVLKLKTLYDMEWLACNAGSAEGEEEVWLMVDTASRLTLLPRVTVEKLRLPTVLAAYPLPGAYPQEPAREYGVIGTLDFGPHRVSNVLFQVVEDEPGTLKYREGRQVLKGILGMDLLRDLQVHFDRKESELRLFPKGTPLQTLLGEDPKPWMEIPAFDVYGQLFTKSSLGEKSTALALLATGCSLVMVNDRQLPGTGLETDSKNIIDLTPSGRLAMSPTGATQGSGGSFKSGYQTGGEISGRGAFQDMGRLRSVLLGWLDEALPMVGKVRSIKGAAPVGLGSGTFQIQSLPVYPEPVGAEFQAAVILGRKITDYYAIAWDLDSGKLYAKQVLFAN